ncbi:type VII secretion protein EccCb [Mycobacterium sp. UM_Kg1]|uniref:type VII secretion protein EccCb n=1 Tax=Mycobacterium sp. UM_Kg1 TaxID=1545691 RepID=UPI00061AA1E6|nr:type VII secretion protein EccCb [Mycobacterium sp. UM_Kg1]
MTGPALCVTPPAPPPQSEIAVAAPPSVRDGDNRMILARLLPIGAGLAILAVTVIAHRAGVSALRSPVAVLPVMMLSSAVALAAAGRNRSGGNGIDDDRHSYLAYLSRLRGAVTESAAAQTEFARWSHPDPDVLWQLTGGPRQWEREPADPAFGSARVGIGPAVPASRLVAPAPDPARRADPVTDAALRRFLDTYAAVPELPVTLAVLGGEPLLLDGDGERARGLLRALLCQLAVLHGPAVLAIAAVTGSRRCDWDWLKWLPHHQHPSASGGMLLTYPDLAAAESDLAGRRAVVISDDPAGLRVAEAGTRGAARRLAVSATTLHDRDGRLGRPDYLSLPDATVCAQRLAWCRAAGSGRGDRGWVALLGIDTVDGFDPPAAWAGAAAQRLCVPIGTDDAAGPVLLDIKEAAERGSGPHGLCIGATGSGKSEFLRTLVLGMVARHSPEDLNLVLVDFKGGATFLEFSQARHVSAVITNLAEEAPLVDRMRDALAGELRRRQQQLREAGLPGVAAYRQARATQPQLPALPALLLIIDEFSELLHRHPDLLDTFVAIGRLGRSLGIHLLLASQRLEEGRLRGLEAHLSYRVCLKTMSAAESRIVLGTTAAHDLENIPGLGILRTADGTLRRFQTAYVSGECPRPVPAPGAVQPFTAAPMHRPAAAADPGARTVLQAMLHRLSGHGAHARRIWLAPLGDSPDLGSVLRANPAARLSVPVGVVDRPFEQRRTALWVRLDGAAGHVAVIGAPQSGKSTALCTLIAALCATHDAARAVFYCLDFGGGMLSGLDAVPQVGAVADRAHPELVGRMVAELQAVVARRETGADRDAPSQGPAPDVFLVIDGWAALCREFDLEAAIVALAAGGLSHGVHVVLAASRWAEVRPALRDLIGTRIELRLGDPAESELDRRQAQQVPQDRPGRGLTAEGMHMRLARPENWAPLRHPDGVVAPPIRLLPAVVAPADVAAAAAGLPVLGIGEPELAAVALDFGRQPHLLILGESECGKTSALRTLCRELVRAHTAEQAQLLVVDYRRGLLDVVPPGHLGGYAVTAPMLTSRLADVTAQLSARLPGAGLTPQQLRARSWWSGPQWFVVVDDHDLVTAGSGNPLTPLLDYLPYAADIGLHLIVACRTGGAARSAYEPTLSALSDLGAMRLAMSGAEAPGGWGRPADLPAGRGTLTTRADGPRLIQATWEP